MKKYIFLLLWTMGLSSAMAKSLLLTLKDGTQVYYLLGGDINPKMTFENGKICVNADNYEITDIKHFVISKEDDPNALDAPQANAQTPRLKGNVLTTATSIPAKDVHVFSLNGTEVEAEKTEGKDGVSIDLNRLPKGVYIVRIGESSLKVTKK